MSSSGERARNSSEEEILLAEDAILSAEDSSPGLAGILQDIQKSLVSLAQASKDLSTAFQNLHDDLLLRQDSDLTIEQGDETGTDTPDCIRCASRRRSPAGRANDISTPHIIWRGKTNLFPRRRSCGVKNFDIIVNYKLIHDSLRGFAIWEIFKESFVKV